MSKKELVILRYDKQKKNEWDAFLYTAKNFHFMHLRDYMNYHADRFEDHSLMFYSEKNELLAILPANSADGFLYSHQGLTFGGIISNEKMKASLMLKIFEELIEYCRVNYFTKILYKKIPYIYNVIASEEDCYALFRVNASLYRRDVTSVINLQSKIEYSKGKKYNINLAKKHNLLIKENQDFLAYWTLLNEVLKERHEAISTHSSDEIIFLKKNFPHNIRLFTIHLPDGQMLAGVVLYITNQVVHTQYMASSSLGRSIGALDFLIDHLIKSFSDKFLYFDFGISNENQGTYLNDGLIFQKEGFGARSVCHDFYEIIL